MGKNLNVQELSASHNGEESRDGKHLDGNLSLMRTPAYEGTNDCTNKKQQPYNNSLTIEDKRRAESRLSTPAGDHDRPQKEWIEAVRVGSERIGGQHPLLPTAGCLLSVSDWYRETNFVSTGLANFRVLGNISLIGLWKSCPSTGTIP